MLLSTQNNTQLGIGRVITLITRNGSVTAQYEVLGCGQRSTVFLLLLRTSM